MPMRWPLVFCICLFAALSAFSGAAEAAKPQRVRVGYYENEVFQEGAQEGAVKTGYAYEYYQKLSEYTGWKYEYVYGGFSDLYQMLLRGEVDLLAGLAYREERAGQILYPDAIMGSENYYLVRRGGDLGLSADPETLADKRIGVLESVMVGVLEDYLKIHGIQAKIVSYPDHIHLFSAFDSGEVDVLAAESDGAYGRKNAEVLSVFGASEYYLCVSAHRPDLLAELNEAQAQLSADEPNYIGSLSAKYYSSGIAARAFSPSERAWIASHSRLSVGYLENYLPYSDTDEKGQVTGILRDMMPELLDALHISDITLSYTGFQSYDAMIAAMGEGRIDAAFPVGGGLYYSEESGIYQSRAVVSAPTELVYRGEFSDSTTRHFAVNENNRMQDYYVRTHFPDAEIERFPSIDDCLMAVLSGKAGCTTLNGLRANDILRNSRYKGLSLRQSNRNDDRCFGVQIGNEGLLKLLNRGVAIIGSDWAQNLSYRYTSALYSYDFWDLLQDHMALVGSAAAAAAALIIFLLVRDSRRSRRVIREKEAGQRALKEKNRELADSREALSRALSTAEEANRAKTVFLNNISHDIRTPMNAIVGFTALAASHLDEKERVRDYLGKITVSSQHLLSLINDVLDMSRIESGKMQLEETDVHLPDVIGSLRAILQPEADAKGLRFLVSADGMVHKDVVTDRLRLNQVLLNLLSNAVKFTPEGGTIRFEVRELPSSDPASAEYRFLVSDNGIGMSPQFQETIFEAFTRERTSTVSGIQGTGLGMAITKSIVDQMGGAITVQSEAGKGSEFTVTIPCRFAAAPVPPELPEESGAPAKACGGRILLAEDNEMNQMIAETILTESGYTVEIAGDGAQAVEKMQSAPAGTFDIILMDIQMPKMDGYEAARQIRNLPDPQKANIPIVAVTANAFEEDRKLALDAGMNGHLAKPYDIPKMLETLKSLLKSDRC